MKHIPFDPNALLTLRAAIDPWPECVRPGVYSFCIHLLLENLTDIPVESPLILFPQLGLDIRPNPPMTIQPTTSGPRKLLSCAASSSLRVEPHGTLDACAIAVSYDRSRGELTLSENAVRGIGEEMSDFLISCATGAANFPLRRMELLVAADVLRAAISSLVAEGSEQPLHQPAQQPDPVPLALSA